LEVKQHEDYLQLVYEMHFLKLPAGQINKIIQILELIDSAQKVPQDFEFFKSWKIHPLKGEWKGFWRVTVKENWPIIFRFVDQNAFDIDYLDH
jgi:toxin HigB-1